MQPPLPYSLGTAATAAPAPEHPRRLPPSNASMLCASGQNDGNTLRGGCAGPAGGRQATEQGPSISRQVYIIANTNTVGDPKHILPLSTIVSHALSEA